jgi:hypothetical protein
MPKFSNFYLISQAYGEYARAKTLARLDFFLIPEDFKG